MLNSFYRTAGSTSDWTIPIDNPVTERYDKCVVLSASIPISFYLVQANYNTFILREPGFADVTISIAPGNYTVSSFCSIVAALLNANSPGGATYTMTVNDSSQVQNGLINYTSTVDSSLVFGTDPVFRQFGFEQDSVNTFVNGLLTSVNVANFIIQDSLLLHADICSNGKKDDVLAVFNYNNTEPLQTVAFLCPDPIAFSRDVHDVNAQSVSFRLTDEDGIPIDLNGVDMSIELCLFRQSKVIDQLSFYLKMKLLEIAVEADKSGVTL